MNESTKGKRPNTNLCEIPQLSDSHVIHELTKIILASYDSHFIIPRKKKMFFVSLLPSTSCILACALLTPLWLCHFFRIAFSLFFVILQNLFGFFRTMGSHIGQPLPSKWTQKHEFSVQLQDIYEEKTNMEDVKRKREQKIDSMRNGFEKREEKRLFELPAKIHTKRYFSQTPLATTLYLDLRAVGCSFFFEARKPDLLHKIKENS